MGIIANAIETKLMKPSIHNICEDHKDQQNKLHSLWATFTDGCAILVLVRLTDFCFFDIQWQIFQANQALSGR